MKWYVLTSVALSFSSSYLNSCTSLGVFRLVLGVVYNTSLQGLVSEVFLVLLLVLLLLSLCCCFFKLPAQRFS